MFKNCCRVKLCNVHANPSATLVATQVTITCHHRSIIQYIHNLDIRTHPSDDDVVPLIFITTISNVLLIKFLIPDANFQYLEFFMH